MKKAVQSIITAKFSWDISEPTLDAADVKIHGLGNTPQISVWELIFHHETLKNPCFLTYICGVLPEHAHFWNGECFHNIHE